ncbi:hypothetical protein ACFYTG_32550 [Streptomyces mirabilis]|uniref:hypothetical protein n=1 Tax=Streptomyces mirabilis TaxID=68239 RepID=UPI0036AAFC04
MVTAQQEPDTTDVTTAVETLREALKMAEISLPSLGTDQASPSLKLITLGPVRADVALRLAQVIRRGCE